MWKASSDPPAAPPTSRQPPAGHLQPGGRPWLGLAWLGLARPAILILLLCGWGLGHRYTPRSRSSLEKAVSGCVHQRWEGKKNLRVMTSVPCLFSSYLLHEEPRHPRHLPSLLSFLRPQSSGLQRGKKKSPNTEGMNAPGLEGPNFPNQFRNAFQKPCCPQQQDKTCPGAQVHGSQGST